MLLARVKQFVLANTMTGINPTESYPASLETTHLKPTYHLLIIQANLS